MTHGVRDWSPNASLAIACGHPDGNDGDALADDPMHKLLLDRDPIDGAAWPRSRRCRASSRRPRARTLYRLSRRAGRHRDRPPPPTLSARRRRVTIDLDVTEDPTHGAQQLAFFNGFYDTGAICRWSPR